jgi:CBS domain-containing protein
VGRQLEKSRREAIVGQRIADVMSRNVISCSESDTVEQAAKAMRDNDVGDVVVTSNGRLAGILTDRDVVIRAVADGADPAETTIGQIVTDDVVTAGPDESVGDLASRMADAWVRRIPVVEGDQVVGIVSLGDLAEERDPNSVLGEISSAPPNQ